MLTTTTRKIFEEAHSELNDETYPIKVGKPNSAIKSHHYYIPSEENSFPITSPNPRMRVRNSYTRMVPQLGVAMTVPDARLAIVQDLKTLQERLTVISTKDKANNGFASKELKYLLSETEVLSEIAEDDFDHLNKSSTNKYFCKLLISTLDKMRKECFENEANINIYKKMLPLLKVAFEKFPEKISKYEIFAEKLENFLNLNSALNEYKQLVVSLATTFPGDDNRNVYTQWLRCFLQNKNVDLHKNNSNNLQFIFDDFSEQTSKFEVNR